MATSYYPDKAHEHFVGMTEQFQKDFKAEFRCGNIDRIHSTLRWWNAEEETETWNGKTLWDIWEAIKGL